MRVLITGKQAGLRSALKTLLQTRRGFEITGTAADKEELFVQLEAEDPDLLLLDEDLARNLVRDVIVPLQQIEPNPIVMVLGGRIESRKTFLDAGAVAFVNKSDSPKSLLTTIEDIRLRSNGV